MLTCDIETKFSDNAINVKYHLRNSIPLLDFNKLSTADFYFLKDLFVRYQDTSNSKLKDISDTIKDIDTLPLQEAKSYLKRCFHRIDLTNITDSELETLKEFFLRNRGCIDFKTPYKGGVLPLGPTSGTSVIPKDQWIDINKKYTFRGRPVINMTIELYSETGEEYTYPIKGDVVIKQKPFTTRWTCWTLDGRHIHSDDDELKEVK